MTFQANPDAIPFFIASAVSTALALFAGRRRATPIATAFTLMMVGEAAWALFEALELVIADLETKKLCFMFRATGTVTMILSLLATVLLYTGRDRWLKPRGFAVICAPTLVLLVIAWTNQWHHLYWTRLWNAQINGHWIAMPVYGPFFVVHFVDCYVLGGVSAFLLAGAVYRSKGVYRAQAAVMLFGALLPWVINIVDMSRIFGFIYVDSAAIGFAVTGLAFVPGLFHYRLLDLTPVAWAAVVEGIHDPVVVIDLEGRVVELNPAARWLTGSRTADFRGTSVAYAFPSWPALGEHLRGIADRDFHRFELDGPESASPSSFDASVSALGEKDNRSGWVLVLRDNTLCKRAAVERTSMLNEQAARTRAEAASIAKDRFLATLSHELRTPLTPVLATVTAMLADPSTPDPLQSVLEMIRRNVVLEARLIDDLLDLSRIRSGSFPIQREVVDAHQLVSAVIDICRDDLREGQLELAVELGAGRHHIDADPIRFQQALWNLVKNAIKFTPAGGRLTVRSRNHGPSADGDGNAGLEIEVRDTGIGIERALLPRIFDVLEQGGISVTRRFGGLGLGLTISRSIIEQHGGRLAASSPGAGSGASFTIEMLTAAPPAETDLDDPQTAAPASNDFPHYRALKILFVEDDVDTIDYLAGFLSRRGHRVYKAADISSALEIACEDEFDMMVSDIELPDGTGFALMAALGPRRNFPAIALSGFGAPDDVEQSRSAGFAIHLTKPVDFRQLEQAIGQLAAGTLLTSSAVR